MKKTIILSTVIGSLFFMSCSEEAVNPTNPNAPEVKVEKGISERLEGTWSETSLTVEPAIKIGDFTTKNPFEFKKDCEKDDLMILKPGNQLQIDPGALTCENDPNMPAPGSWEVHEDRNELIMDGVKYQIAELNDSEVRLNFEKTMNQVKYTFTTTFARK